MAQTNKKDFYGERLRLIRSFHGLTLEELGNMVSVSRQYIQRLELDPKTSSPNKDMVAAFAETLEVEPGFFFEPVIGEAQEEFCHFRKRKATPAHLRKTALAYATIFCSIIAYLDEKLNFPEIDFPSKDVKTREDIEKAAEDCRQQWGLRLDAPIDNTVRTIENAGGIVTTFDTISTEIDAFSYEQSRPVVVRNTAKRSTSRARFDLAHEVGHLVLHKGIEANDLSQEDQANLFASAFLLPRVSFFQEFPRATKLNWSELLKIKDRWKVSLQAIIRRAYDLNLFTAVQYRKANVFIGGEGWKTNEPNEEKIPAEIPEVVTTAFEMLNKQGIRPDVVAKDLNIKLEIINKYGFDFQDSMGISQNSNLISIEVLRTNKRKGN